MRLPLLRNVVLALFAGLILTSILAGWVYRLESQNAHEDFAKKARLLLSTLEDSFDDSLAGLKAINQLFMTSPHPVDRVQFHHFVRPLLDTHPYVQSFVFHRLIRHEERARYEAEMRTVFPGLRITELRAGELVPAARRAAYLVDHYIEPLAKNMIVLGYDSWSDQEQANAIERAIDTGQASASALKPLLQRAPEERGFVVLMPVYRQGMPLHNVQARREAFIGDTEAVFVAHEFISSVLSRADLLNTERLQISVYAASGPVAAERVFHHVPSPGRATGARQQTGARQITLKDELSYTLNWAGQPWHVVISQRPSPLASVYPITLLTLLAGILITLTIAINMHAASVRTRRIEALVAQRTAELRATAGQLLLRNRAIEACANAIIISSADGPEYAMEYVNPAFERLTGYSTEEAIGRSLLLLMREDVQQPGMAEFLSALRAGREGHAIVRSYCKNGTMYWNDMYSAPVRDDKGKIIHFVHAQYDITDVKRYEKELEYRANHDTLTGLANRNLLRDRLQQAMSYAARFKQLIWIAYVDLDRFKYINDSAGHTIGDAVLATLAARLKESLRETDTAARIGGDEFVLVLPMYEGDRDRMQTIQHIMAAMAEPVTLHDKPYFITCSIGIAAYPDDGRTVEALLTNADVAMYRAKELGRNNFQFFTSSMNANALERLALEGGLRVALQNNEFALHYQPQVNLQTGAVVGMEALLRWTHGELGSISPARFIGLAEEIGLIVSIGDWVLNTACAQAKAWQMAGVGEFRIAVNLSAVQFAQADIVATVARALQASGLAPPLLELEMTESMVMQDVERAIRTLQALKALGVHLSIDDFGTAYSSLAYLKHFPVDVLKIDQSFVRELRPGSADAKIVISIITLAHSLGLHVIAEGVENATQLAFLQQHGCDEIQGNYFSGPLAPHQLEPLLKTTLLPAGMA